MNPGVRATIRTKVPDRRGDDAARMGMTGGVRKISVLYTGISDGQVESVMTVKPLRGPVSQC